MRPGAEHPRANLTSADFYRHSSLVEKVIEHLFVGELLRTLWRRGHRDFEVLRAEVDRGGYDLAVECGGIFRHIQLKASAREAKTKSVNIRLRLASKPLGCVIWILFDPESMNLGPYRWLGGTEQASPLDLSKMKVAKHTRADATGYKAERPDMRKVTSGKFINLETMDEVVLRLFGRED